MCRLKKTCTIAFVFLVFLVSSCKKSSIYNEFVTFDNETWDANNNVKFTVDVSDTVSYFNILLNIRNTTDYPNSNLFLFVSTSSPNSIVQNDTIEIFLADEKGKWLGSGVGKLRDNQFPYQQNIRFPVKGIYTFGVQQAMRTEKLEGIYNVGIRIEKAK